MEQAVVDKKYICQCGKAYTRNDSLRRHVRTKQCDGKQITVYENCGEKFRCDQCGKAYARNDSFRRHVKIQQCNSKQDAVNEDCGKKFKCASV